MSTASRVQRRQLSEILVDEGVAQREDVDNALKIQAKTGETLVAILADMGAVVSPAVAKLVCQNYQLPFISMRNYDLDTKLIGLLPAEFLHQNKLLPFDSIGQMLLCAVAEIPSEKALAEIPKATQRKVAFFVGDMDEISKLLQQHAPLSENSELLQRRKQAQPEMTAASGAGAEAGDPTALFSDQSSEKLLEALDSTWESIFDEMEGGGGSNPPGGGNSGSSSSG